MEALIFVLAFVAALGVFMHLVSRNQGLGFVIVQLDAEGDDLPIVAEFDTLEAADLFLERGTLPEGEYRVQTWDQPRNKEFYA